MSPKISGDYSINWLCTCTTKHTTTASPPPQQGCGKDIWTILISFAKRYRQKNVVHVTCA